MMTRRDHITVAKVIRDTTTIIPGDERITLAEEMASALEPISRNFDRALFMAYATSASMEE